MTINELYTQLVNAYSHENLNRITAKLILLYKNKNYSRIRSIANKISDYILIDEEKDARCFSRLIMLYHPDKGESIRSSIQQYYEENDYNEINKYAHILLLNDIDQISVQVIDDSIEYNPEYAWDSVDEESYAYTDEDGNEEHDNELAVDEFERNFFNMLKIREYGRVDIEVPTYYLEDFEEFEMAYSKLESLDGVEYCLHVKILDLSNNAISDLGNLWNLNQLEELYLANNQIGYIDTLCNLPNLRIIDLSGNEIDDISPLFNLQNLEYVNLMGNRISLKQKQELEKNCVCVT